MKTVFPTLCSLLLISCGSSAPADIRVGGTIPKFSLTELDGSKYTSKTTYERPVIINFWATWCQPCRTEMPALKQLQKEQRADVIGIALDKDGAGPVKRFVKKMDINYKVLIGNEDIFRTFNGHAIPYTLILDQQGKIVNIHRGPASLETLEQDLAGLEGTTTSAM